MNYYFHIAAANERWDNIAHKYYNNCHNIAPIIMANPHVPVSPIIPEGTEIKVPILESGQVISNANLPVWKQG